MICMWNISQSFQGSSSSFLFLRTSFGVGTSVTPFKLSILGAAEWFFDIESVASISNWSPVFATLRVVKWKFQVSDSVCPEIIVVLQPPPNLSAEIIANRLSRFGVYKVLLTGVKGTSTELVQLEIINKVTNLNQSWKYRCVTPSIGSSGITIEVPKTFWSDVIS